MNLSRAIPTHVQVTCDVTGGALLCGAGSDQKQIDQRDQGGGDTGRDQRIVSPDVAVGIELARFLDHSGGLGQAGRTVCEAGHIRRTFLTPNRRRWGWAPGTDDGRPALMTPPARGSGFWLRTGNGAAASTMAIRVRRATLAVDAGRHHGRSLAPGSPYAALRCLCSRRPARAARPAGIGSVLCCE
jgi:hypothetical protein